MGEGKGQWAGTDLQWMFSFFGSPQVSALFVGCLGRIGSILLFMGSTDRFPFYSSSFTFMSLTDKKTPLLTHLVAGGAAGFMEACSCHPLDTIKVRMQLAKHASRGANVSRLDDVPRNQ